MRNDWLAETTRDGKPLKAGMLRKALYDLWLKHKAEGMLPTSGRFLFYELLGLRPDLVRKGEAGDGENGKKKRPDTPVIKALTDLRELEEGERGFIPWEDIVDETRELQDFNGWDSIENGVRENLQAMELSLWLPQRPPLILCESRSLAGVLRSLAQAYHCLIASTNGQCAGFLYTQVAPRLESGDLVLYFGDADFSGDHIERNNRRVLEKIVGPLDWKRIAITPDQIADGGLTVIQKWDARTKSFHDAVETEALGQAKINRLLRELLTALMPEARRKRVKAREARERREFGRKHRME